MSSVYEREIRVCDVDEETGKSHETIKEYYVPFRSFPLKRRWQYHLSPRRLVINQHDICFVREKRDTDSYKTTTLAPEIIDECIQQAILRDKISQLRLQAFFRRKAMNIKLFL